MKPHIISENHLKIHRDKAKGQIKALRSRIYKLSSETFDEESFKKLQTTELFAKVITDYLTASESHIELLEEYVAELELKLHELNNKTDMFKKLYIHEMEETVKMLDLWQKHIEHGS